MLVTIMRGPPGAGKTWWHEHTYRPAFDKTVRVVSANDFFTHEGVYHYDPSKIGEAHNVCLRDFEWFLRDSAATIEHLIVDNTNLTALSMAPFIALADAHEVPYEIVRVDPELTPEQLFERCTHHVPLARIRDMQHQLRRERLPRFWRSEIQALDSGLTVPFEP